MSRLMIQVLGPFIVTKDDQPVIFSYDKVRALLAYLAVETARPGTGGAAISRIRLASLLWPDQPQIAAQDSLRQALSRLRAQIGDRDSFPSFLLVERDTVQINPAASIQIDLEAFQEAFARVNTHHHRSLAACPNCAAFLEKAAVLIRGDFLEDLCLPDSDLFEHWATTQRERIQIQALELFNRLAQSYELRGDTDRILAYAARQLQIDPYHEPAHLQVMRALARSGQRSQAVQHFKHFKQILADELGISPSDEILELFAAIQQGKAQPDPNTAKVRNLPASVNPLVGRTVELSELTIWLSDPDRRLISVMGPGGIGKTCLVIQVARQAATMFPGGVVYVPLVRTGAAATLTPPAHSQKGEISPLAAAIAQSLFASSGAAWEQVFAAIQKQEMLLVLDGFEHVFGEQARIAQLLEANPGLVVLVTTRQRLNLPGEWVFGLGGLDIPPAYVTRQLEAYSAVTLFCQFAQQGNQDFELNETNQDCVVEICRLLGGLPLAIRLAAAWTRSLPCTEITAELHRGLDILSSQVALGTDDEPSGVRAVFEQSWNRLEPADQEVFARLSAFRGSFDHAAAEQVAGATIATLKRLVNQSLVRMSLEGRYDLHDLLHQFGAEKLQQAGKDMDAHQRHFEWYYAQAEQNERMLNGTDTLKAFIWLIREAANLQEALAWAQGNAPQQATQLVRWMHPEFHQMGVHVFNQHMKGPSADNFCLE